MENFQKITNNVISMKGKSFFMSGKHRNRLQRSINGNGPLKISHWNAGSKHWERGKKIDIELLIRESNPDLLFVSGANLYSSIPNWEKDILGYRLIAPGSLEKNGYARIVLMVKDSMDVHLLPEFMEDDLAMIWVLIGRRSKSSLHIGSIYRQHKLPNQGDMKRLTPFPSEGTLGQNDRKLFQSC